MRIKASNTIAHEYFQGTIRATYKFLINHINKEHFVVELTKERTIDAIEFLENYNEIRAEYTPKSEID
jgi:hypothetical protein